MDKTKEYIDMCEKASELKRLWIPSQGDFICNTKATNKKGDGFVNYIYVNYEYQPCKRSSEWVLIFNIEDKSKLPFNIWFPRQDQLQDMTCKELNFIEKLQLFYNYVKNKKPNVNSMEQLWLSFVMRMEYKKEWVDNEWRFINGH